MPAGLAGGAYNNIFPVMNSPEKRSTGFHGDTGLPVPDDHALTHSRRLADRIRAVIRGEGGAISFSRYMELALYEPGLGYYSAGARKFGEAGDFITAPELSPLFSRCVARQCLEILDIVAGGSLLEIGPGSGVMACDILLALEQLGRLPATYLMLETSADLRERQRALVRERIPRLARKVMWLDSLPEQTFDGLVLGNEVLDALPVDRIVIDGKEIRELAVVSDQDGFTWRARPLTAPLRSFVDGLFAGAVPDLPPGYVIEINSRLGPWLAALSEKLRRGIMLFFDYGWPRRDYLHPQRSDGTLLCHYRHRRHQDPFLYPGLQDITAAVDFTLVAEAAADAGMTVSGYTTLAHFLMGCGLEQAMASERDQAESARQARILTLPGEMGENVKVIALAKAVDMALCGFRFFDQRRRL